MTSVRLSYALDQSRQANCAKTQMLGQNYFADPNWHVLTFLHPIFFGARSHSDHCYNSKLGCPLPSSLLVIYLLWLASLAFYSLIPT